MSERSHRRPDKVLVYLYRRLSSGRFGRSASEGLEYLLLQRAPTSNAGSIWQTVAGTVKWNEDRVETIRREVFEETGLTGLQGLTAIGYAFSFPIRLPPDQRSNYPPQVNTIHSIAFVAEVVGTRSIRLSDEHVDYGWFSYPDAMEKIHWPEEKEALTRLHSMLQGQA